MTVLSVLRMETSVETHDAIVAKFPPSLTRSWKAGEPQVGSRVYDKCGLCVSLAESETVEEALQMTFKLFRKKVALFESAAALGVKWELDLGAGVGDGRLERSCTVGVNDMKLLCSLGIELRLSVYWEETKSP